MSATIIHAPDWADTNAQPGTLAGDLQQLINLAGPMASGMAVALATIQAAEQAEHDGATPALDSAQRRSLLGLCAVSAQLLSDAASDACDALISHQTENPTT
jgi:hypothetical protein